MEKNRADELESIASEVRKDIVRMVGVARSGPLEVPFAISNLLVYLYWEELLVVADSPSRVDRDRFMLGINDGTPALYAVLARRGYFEREDLWHYRRLGAMLQALPDFKRIPGIDAPFSENCNELAVASAVSECLRTEGIGARVFCLLDEEIFSYPDFILEVKRAAEEKLDHLVILVVMQLGNPALSADRFSKHESVLTELGWPVCRVDGSSFYDMERAFGRLDINNERPNAIFVNTKNGTKLSFVESHVSMKSRTLSLDDMDQVLEELEGKINE